MVVYFVGRRCCRFIVRPKKEKEKGRERKVVLAGWLFLLSLVVRGRSE
jgi:hypothetical protein